MIIRRNINKAYAEYKRKYLDYCDDNHIPYSEKKCRMQYERQKIQRKIIEYAK